MVLPKEAVSQRTCRLDKHQTTQAGEYNKHTRYQLYAYRETEDSPKPDGLKDQTVTKRQFSYLLPWITVKWMAKEMRTEEDGATTSSSAAARSLMLGQARNFHACQAPPQLWHGKSLGSGLDDCRPINWRLHEKRTHTDSPHACKLWRLQIGAFRLQPPDARNMGICGTCQQFSGHRKSDV